MASPGGKQSEEGEQSVPAPNADAGSIDKHGIELAVILAVGSAAVIVSVIGSTCYDPPKVRG